MLHPVARLPDEWRAHLTRAGESAYRGDQVFRWIHGHGVMSPSGMSNLPARLKERLVQEGFEPPIAIERVHRSEDGTRKLLAVVSGGERIETVLLPSALRAGYADSEFSSDIYDYSNNADEDAPDRDGDAGSDAGGDAGSDGDGDGDGGGATGKGAIASARVTQCVSTQVGCAMGCVFCASGIAGLKRQLGAEEIVGQLYAAAAFLEPGEVLRGVVFMGMGEPLHNYDATVRAIRLMTHEHGLGLSPRRITVSTSGLVPEIDRLGADFGGKVRLAISLHQADDARRTALMPINQKYPLATLMAALRRYPLEGKSRITVEYTLVHGHNDSISDARKLARLLEGLHAHVNLIPMNSIEHSELGPPTMADVLAFQRVIVATGLRCFVRRRRGDDVAAACGQLVMLGERPNARFLARQPRK
ncbi:MAG: 23S rRNA (adenine(2503)-C(2))-methyltransferase RlmN [Myxococcales bacterium]|nr:23S rRNA (adenine(2503)-C(2))-methyltransferase RlmN [Myxococcales bacterium]